MQSLSDDPLCERVLTDEQALLMNSLFIMRRAQTFEDDVEALVTAAHGSELNRLLEAASHSLSELHISALVSSEMVREINLAFEAWMAQNRIVELTLGCVTAPGGVN